ncbi:MAG: multiheme c-type cytochrome [Planctomycetota bacterium]|nr:multiheme c-type cytochrome [Planctomycetota bacterium]
MRILLAFALLALWQASNPAAAPDRRFSDLKAPAPADERGAELDGWREISCARCHADVVQEWSTTLHGRAWVDEAYREELAEVRRQESCHNCHIPEPLHLQLGADGAIPQKPKARDATLHNAPVPDVDAHFGVSCESCHRGPDGAILGPWGAPTEAHKSLKHASFLPESKSALCVACHATTVGPVIGIAKDFVDTDQAARGRSCVACHMAPVERPAASEDGKPALPARAGRSHALQTPRDPSFLARAFELAAERRGDKVVVRITNACGHRVPGRIGRVLTLEAELLDAAGKVVARGSVAIETKKSLAADATLEIELAGQGQAVRVVGRHAAPALPDDVLFLDRRLALP